MFLDATPSLELVLPVGWLVTLFQIQSFSKSLLVSSCLSLSPIVYHCLPLSPIVSHCLPKSLDDPFTLCQCLSMYLNISQCQRESHL